MSDDKNIVPLRRGPVLVKSPSQTEQSPVLNSHAIEDLELALDLAKKGELIAVAIAGVYRDRDTFETYAANADDESNHAGDLYLALGALGHRFVSHIVTGVDPVDPLGN